MGRKEGKKEENMEKRGMRERERQKKTLQKEKNKIGMG